MFTHIVMFKLNNPTKENVERGRKLLEGMNGNIPMLKSAEVGTDVVRSDRSYDLCLIARFDNVDDMEAYQVHTYHVNEVLKYLRPMTKSSVTVDFES